MHFSTLFLISTTILGAINGAVAVPTTTNALSQMPGYPYGWGWCLSDDQAEYIVNGFKKILTSTNRNVTATTAQYLLADDFVEYSDSINIQAGNALGGPTFKSKTAFISLVVPQPAIPTMKTLDIFHDCNRIAWRYTAIGLAKAIYPVNGISTFTVNNPTSGQIDKAFVEFNSIAWGVDVGGTYTPPPRPT